MFRKLLLLVAFTVVLTTAISVNLTQAQEGTAEAGAALIRDEVTIQKARVLEVISQEERNVPGTDVRSNYQTLRIEILDGPEKGKVVTLENDHLNLKEGETFFVQHTVNEFDGIDIYSVSDPYRLPAIYFFIGLFVLCVLLFGGKQGARGLIALILSFAFILYFLLPGIIAGYPPALVAIVAASLIIIIGSYITHGFNRITSSAVIGMVITIVITGVLAYLGIYFGRLSGFSSDESVYLNLNTGGTIDFAGLLFGGILIGLLGVLYDAAIGQAVSVDELSAVGPHLPRNIIFKRALRIGREHIGALVNSLAIAYVGASLPLLLLFYYSTATPSLMMNQEIFATEIIRIMISSIGLVLAVPITTLVAVAILVKSSSRSDGGTGSYDDLQIEREEKAIESITHRH